MTPVLLQPTTVECNSLRVRRGSSIRPLDLLPRLFTDETPVDLGESAVDDVSDAPAVRPHSYTPPISTPSDVHIPYDSIYRHQYSLPYIDTSLPTSSAASVMGTSFPSALSSGKTSMTTDTTVTPFQQTRMKQRLFSAFLAYFLCGWGDGSLS